MVLTLTLIFTFVLGGWRSVVVVPDQPLLLFGRGWSGTFETERSHPHAPGRPIVPNTQGAYSAGFFGRGGVLGLRAWCPGDCQHSTRELPPTLVGVPCSNGRAGGL